MARDDPQFRIRLPADLKAWVEESATQNSRSLNAEIVHILMSARAHAGKGKMPTEKDLQSLSPNFSELLRICNRLADEVEELVQERRQLRKENDR